MDSRYLRAFVTVADLGGITAAATHLGYAQSSLSAQLRRLEHDLGVSVLDRTTSGTVLTEAGRRLLPYAREALDLDDRMRDAVLRRPPALRIGALETLASEWLPDIVTALDHGAAGPGMRADVTLSVGSRQRLIADLAGRRLDLIFLYDNGVGTAEPHAIVGADRTVLVAAPEHPLAGAETLDADDLLETEFLIAEPGCTTSMLVDRFGRDVTSRAPIGMITGSLAALLRMLSLGRGVALLPWLTAAPHLAAGELVELNLAAGLASVQVEARWRTTRGPADQVIQALVRLARRNAPQPDTAQPA